MTKQEVSERFSGGRVKYMVTTHKAVQWLGRILGIIICVALIKWAPHDVGNRMLCYAVVVYLLWWVHGLDVILVYICENGFVIKQRPTNLRDYFRSAINTDEYYVWIPFENVVGFTPDWKELQAVNMHGGIYVVPLDLQLAPYKDKLRLQAAIKHYRDTHGQ